MCIDAIGQLNQYIKDPASQNMYCIRVETITYTKLTSAHTSFTFLEVDVQHQFVAFIIYVLIRSVQLQTFFTGSASQRQLLIMASVSPTVHLCDVNASYVMMNQKL